MLIGREAAYLLVWAVRVMFYRACANKHICAVKRPGKWGQAGETKTIHTSPIDTMAICNCNQ